MRARFINMNLTTYAVLAPFSCKFFRPYGQTFKLNSCFCFLSTKFYHSFKHSSKTGGQNAIADRFSSIKPKYNIKGNGQSGSKVSPKIGQSESSTAEIGQLAAGGGLPRTAKDIWKPILFAFGFSGCCYCGAVIWHYERHRTAMDMKRWGYEVPHRKASEIRDQINRYWNSITEGEKAIYSLTALNALVFILWRSPRLYPLMTKYFLNGFYSEKLYSSMVLSAFSHVSLWHIALNMYALSTFGIQAVNHLLGLEQFFGFYLAAAAMSNCASLVSKGLSGIRVVSLGASGAILAVLIYSCAKYPNQKLQILFLPFFTFTCEQGIKGILAFEAACLFLLPRRYRLFDHAAHLGGSLFGLWYANYGEHFLWKVNRYKILNWYRDISGRR